jgi:hypothetical protein
MGGVLDVLGIEGFLENLNDLYEEADSEGTAYRWLVARWHDLLASDWIPISKLFLLTLDEDCPLDLGYGPEGPRRHRLALTLDKIRDRHFSLEDGTKVHIEKSEKMHHHQRRWRLVVDEHPQRLV